MRGPDRRTEGLFSYVTCESRLSAGHPLRAFYSVRFERQLMACPGTVAAGRVSRRQGWTTTCCSTDSSPSVSASTMRCGT